MSSPPKYAIHPQSMIRTCQIITGALIAGVVIFALVALIISPERPAPQPFIAYVAILVAAQLVVLRFFIPSLVVKARLKDAKVNARNFPLTQLPPLFQTKLIVGLGLLEGAAFFNLVAYLLERQWFSIVTAGVMLLLLVMMFPTLNKYERWVDDFQRNLSSVF